MRCPSCPQVCFIESSCNCSVSLLCIATCVHVAMHNNDIEQLQLDVFFSIDGNFGLCWKKPSGSSVRPPLHDRKCFLNRMKLTNM